MTDHSHSAHGHPCSIVALTGFMGSGKSSAGRALAAQLGWRFLDLDEEIETRQGQQIRDIFVGYGEPRFRELETEALTAVLNLVEPPFVLSTGGGAFVQPVNTALFRSYQVPVVFLEVSTKILLQRCCSDEAAEERSLRPLAADPGAFLQLYETRLPLYRQADLTILSDDRSPETIAREIIAALHLCPATK